MGLVQEKFQTVAPEPPAGSNEWVSDKSARRQGSPVRQQVGPAGVRGAVLNQLPPGSDIGRQALADIRRPMRTMGGETDVSRDYNQEAKENGYTRLPMSPTEDQYTAEHTDTFYAEAKVDGQVGFVERGNLLDRQ